MSKRHFEAPAPEYVGPPKHFWKGSNKPILDIVIHSTVSPCVPGGRYNIGRLFREGLVKGSAQYITDPAGTVQAAYDSVICWAAPPNEGKLNIEMCDIPGTNFVHRVLKMTRWARKNQRLMLHETARLTAKLCLAYDVDPHFRTVRQLKNGRHGVTTHNNISKAFHESTHWDPGVWPRRYFMRMVRREMRRIRENS